MTSNQQAAREWPTAEWVIGYLPAMQNRNWKNVKEGYEAGYSDAVQLCKEQIRFAFEEWREMEAMRVTHELMPPIPMPPPEPVAYFEELTLLDRVEFALRDAGFDYDLAFKCAWLAEHGIDPRTRPTPPDSGDGS